VASDAKTIRIGNPTVFTDLQGVSHPVHRATSIAGIHRVNEVGRELLPSI
jgi:hypothetical protein